VTSVAEITAARARTIAAVRIVTERYAIAACLSLEAAVAIRNAGETGRNLAFTYAWRATCEWFSCGWDVSERPDLLDAWRKASADGHVADRLRDAMEVGVSLKPCCPGFGVKFDQMEYFSDARRDLEALLSLSLRRIPVGYDESDLRQPEGFLAFVQEEFATVLVRSQLQSAAFEASPLGRLLCPTIKRRIDDEGPRSH
jgi:hypothetical protein